MHKFLILLLLASAFAPVHTKAQDTLPKISARNIDGRIIISWRNNYARPITNINIQRSFDSGKNFTSIGSVLNPQNKENGFADARPPYTKMYYRVFVAFEGGSYVYTNTTRPVKDTTTRKIPENLTTIVTDPPKPLGWIPSKRIFTGKESYIIINLPDAAVKKYSVKFFDENDKLVIELSKIPDTYLTLEKVNFIHAGWFHFELYENGALLEKNKCYVLKDGKNQQIPLPVEQGKKNRVP